jgi:hypothetical protein
MTLGVANAQQFRYIQTAGTSTGTGTCSITIESFGSIGFRAQSTLSTIINVPIPASSTAQNSSILIRNALNAGLTADYSASIVGPNGDFVKLFRNTGTFTMSISENVPVQNMFEVTSVPVPALGPWGALILALGLVAIAAHALTRRRRSSENIA